LKLDRGILVFFGPEKQLLRHVDQNPGIGRLNIDPEGQTQDEEKDSS
jgi:hypothetical protein